MIRLQTALKNLGLYALKIDGIYGKGTLAAVKAYQRKNGLKVDGIAGPKTLGKLYASAGSETAATSAASAASAESAASGKTTYRSLKLGCAGDDVKDLPLESLLKDQNALAPLASRPTLPR